MVDLVKEVKAIVLEPTKEEIDYIEEVKEVQWTIRLTHPSTWKE